jgi:hypothetical protein
MPAARDFRRARVFAIPKVAANGRDIGKVIYWKLFVVENLVRVALHSVMSLELGAGWLEEVAGPDLKKKITWRREDYGDNPWNTKPGAHDLYYLDLKDLGELVRSHSHLFKPILTNIDHLVGEIERCRLPRNVVAHMSSPSEIDRKRIDVLHADISKAVEELASKVKISVPR